MLFNRKISFKRIRQSIGWDLSIPGKQKLFDEQTSEYWFYSTFFGHLLALVIASVYVTSDTKDEKHHTLFW